MLLNVYYIDHFFVSYVSETQNHKRVTKKTLNKICSLRETGEKFLSFQGGNIVSSFVNN